MKKNASSKLGTWILLFLFPALMLALLFIGSALQEYKILTDKYDTMLKNREVGYRNILDYSEIIEDAEAQIFSFVSDLVEGRKAQALKILAKLKKRGEAPSYLLASLIGQYRRMLHASLSKKSDADLAATMGVKEYAVKKARSSRKLGKKQLKAVVEMLVDYELKFKSGEMSDKVAFDAAIGRLIGEEAN